MPVPIGQGGVSASFLTRVRIASVVALALLATACSFDVTQSEEYQALENQLEDLATTQAETERQLADVESQLASTEGQIQSVQDRLAEAEGRNLDLESDVRELVESLSVEAGEDSQNVQPNPEAEVIIYGDGDISCPDHRADDESLPVGTIVYQPGEGEIRIFITLTDAAPNVFYGVELWSDESCAADSHPLGFGGWEEFGPIETDGNGAGELDLVLTHVDPGMYRLNVNLSTGDPHEDPRHREMGTAQFTELVVP